MPELKWNEYEVIECLGVLPEVEEYETSYVFNLEKNNIVLLMNVFHHESLIAISLYQAGSEDSFITLWIVARGGIRYVNDKHEDFLEFNHIVVVNSRGYYLQGGDVYDESKFPHHLKLELRVNPQISLKIT